MLATPSAQVSCSSTRWRIKVTSKELAMAAVSMVWNAAYTGVSICTIPIASATYVLENSSKKNEKSNNSSNGNVFPYFFFDAVIPSLVVFYFIEDLLE